jgi:DNA repair protein RadC
MKTYKTECPELKVQLKRDVVLKAKITSSQNSADFFREIWDDTIDIYESFFVIYLNQASNTIGWYKVSQGGITGTVADPRLIIKKALDILATGFIMCHNHPSGNLKPSEADIALTKKIKSGAEFLDIRLIDHIILTTDGYYSFNDSGLVI